MMHRALTVFLRLLGNGAGLLVSNLGIASYGPSSLGRRSRCRAVAQVPSEGAHTNVLREHDGDRAAPRGPIGATQEIIACREVASKHELDGSRCQAFLEPKSASSGRSFPSASGSNRKEARTSLG